MKNNSIIFFTSSNNNNIRLPEGKILRDLHTFTYRNGSIYRYDNNIIILNENDEILITKNDEVTGDPTLITSTPYRHVKKECECTATCKCYVDDDDDRRIGGSSLLLFSKRYTSVVFVSIVSYALAKFVNDHIDDCYQSAKSILGDDVPFVCGLFDDLEEFEWDPDKCDCQEKFYNYWGQDDDIPDVGKDEDELYRPLRLYECNGHCLSKNILLPMGITPKENQKCESHYYGKKEIMITTDVRNEFDDHAKTYYQMNFLYYYCNSFKTTTLSTRVWNEWEGKNLYPCAAYRIKYNKHVKCKLLRTYGEEDWAKMGPDDYGKPHGDMRWY